MTNQVAKQYCKSKNSKGKPCRNLAKCFGYCECHKPDDQVIETELVNEVLSCVSLYDNNIGGLVTNFLYEDIVEDKDYCNCSLYYKGKNRCVGRKRHGEWHGKKTYYGIGDQGEITCKIVEMCYDNGEDIGYAVYYSEGKVCEVVNRETGDIIEYHPNGKVKETKRIIVVDLYEDGEVTGCGTTLDGEHKKYYKDGFLWYECNYIDEVPTVVKDGEVVRWCKKIYKRDGSIIYKSTC